MARTELIGAYICMLQTIYIYRQFGILAANVSDNQTITGLLGNNDTDITCSFFLEKTEHGLSVFSVEIFAKNITEDFHDRKPIAIFEPEKAARLHTSVKYLFERVTLTNITHASTYATMKFHILKYIDEKDYMCKYNIIDIDGALSAKKSEQTRILVKDPVGDVHINTQPNQKQYDRKTDNITLTCKASGDPEPKYKWFKEDNNSSTNLFVIEDVIRNNSGLYICQAYNIINNVKYRHSSAVEIDITDELVPTTESDSLKTFSVHAAYAIPVTCAVVVVVVCLAVRKRNCKREKRNVPAVTVIYSEVNEQTKLKYRLTKNQATPLQHNHVQQDAVDGAHKVSSDPTLKYNMITGKLEVYTTV